MNRLFSIVLLLILAACGTHTTQTPAAGDPTDEHAANDTRDEVNEGKDASPTWRYAQPPPGTQQENAPTGRDVERYSERKAPSEAPRRSAPSELGMDSSAAPAPAPVQEPSAPANKRSAPSTGGIGDGEAARGRALSADKAESSAKGGAVAQQQPRDDRPGLGTTWGETRYSAVSEVSFQRDSEAPSYTAAMHYNDYRGASALAGGASYARNASVGMGSALTMSLRDEYGNIMSAFRGNGRTVAIGEHGQRYTIVIDNNTNERFEVVLSVDGLDVLDGRDAGYGKRGYLIDSYGHLEVEGFRQSEDAVAAFRFGSVRDSYAARTGSARNVGVIGCAAFGERGYHARLVAYQERMAAIRAQGGEIERRRTADPFPNRYATPPQWVIVR